MSEGLDGLKAGIRRFRTEIYPDAEQVYRRAMREPQRPDALLVTCSDSRIQPDVLTQTRPGELFVTRNIGNIVPAYGQGMDGAGAVLEYAVSALGVKHVVVCGHTDCGAMKALLDPASVATLPAVERWLENAQEALSVARAMRGPDENGMGLLQRLTEQNVLLQMRQVATHPSVADAVARGKLTISGWVYDIAEGEVRMCEDGGEGFTRLA